MTTWMKIEDWKTEAKRLEPSTVAVSQFDDSEICVFGIREVAGSAKGVEYWSRSLHRQRRMFGVSFAVVFPHERHSHL